MSVLTIARQYGSGGKEIGEAVAASMGYDYVSRKRILDEMRKVGAHWEEHAKSFDEVEPGSWERYKWSFRGFVALSQYQILSHALQDNVVIMGRGGNFLLKGLPFVLRIRTVAPDARRIENIMRWEEEASSENARYLMQKADEDMAGAVYLI
jgi:hypothetical protein